MTALLQKALDINTQLSGLQSVDQVCMALASSLQETLSLPDNVIYLRTRKDTFVQVAAGSNKCSEQGQIIAPLSLSSGQGVVGMAAQNKSSIRVEDTRENEHYIVDDQCRLSELAVPLVYDGEVYGVIDSEHPELAYFSEEDEVMLNAIAAMVTPKIAHLMAKSSLKRAVSALNEQLIDSFEPQFSDTRRLDSALPLLGSNQQLSELSQKEFCDATNHLLKHYNDSQELISSPLMKCLIARHQIEGSSSSESQHLKNLKLHVSHLIRSFRENPATQLWSRILERSYIQAGADQHTLSEQFNMGYSTFRRHLAKARSHLALELWALEETLRHHRN
ncbi:GAF domain-containing protein [Pleionea sp. CnH1-48]|uniref:GAF domain-containing protein n=1 Tax=Pleionea sp. CnH1-48 TaxID=2954494 RepID=UPI00209711C8|nr:GAF domain-containing protein [Pleionea sp. CnH1-48]MCO7224086.1 GAF domain-containing protein [Pleionea sp. CnH1-48]